MYRLGCCIPGGSFMPQGVKEVPRSTAEILKEGFDLAMAGGYDYIEATVGLCLALTDEEAKAAYKNGINIEVMNSFIPPKYPIINGDIPTIGDYLKRAGERMATLGTEIVVFGSGKARDIPEGVERSDGVKQFREFSYYAGDILKKYNVTVVLEPLNCTESNIVNTVREGAEHVRAIEHDNVKLLADSFHMFCEKEDFGAITENADIIKHIHVADGVDRRYPGHDGGDYLRGFAEALKKTSYSGRVTVECSFEDFGSECALAHKFLVTAF